MNYKKLLRIFSPLVFSIGLVFVFNSRFDITGAFVGIAVSGVLNYLIGFGLMIISVVMFIAGVDDDLGSRVDKLKKRLENDLKSGKIGKYKDLKKYAKSLGYTIKEGGEHIVVKDDQDHFVTTIPRGSQTDPNTYKGIEKKLLEYLK